ncbi:MAG: hypothetical protein JSS79_14545 [Bacteroidetes bacterium]|nr:hypothetical protein [Bacteroidota bacterium]
MYNKTSCVYDKTSCMHNKTSYVYNKTSHVYNKISRVYNKTSRVYNETSYVYDVNFRLQGRAFHVHHEIPFPEHHELRAHSCGIQWWLINPCHACRLTSAQVVLRVRLKKECVVVY